MHYIHKLSSYIKKLWYLCNNCCIFATNRTKIEQKGNLYRTKGEHKENIRRGTQKIRLGCIYIKGYPQKIMEDLELQLLIIIIRWGSPQNRFTQHCTRDAIESIQLCVVLICVPYRYTFNPGNLVISISYFFKTRNSIFFFFINTIQCIIQ